MEPLAPYLADIWLTLIGFFLLYYAVTDGSDLGVGVLSLFTRSEAERGLMMATLRATIHGNQTWLVLLGGMLFGAFPLFYAIVLSSLYIPMVVMLFGLIFRGVAFEFREHSRHRLDWDLAFGLGSLLVALAQGYGLGGLLSGLTTQGGRFVGGAWGWLTPFSTLIAVGVVLGYTMLGANYLVMKTEGPLQERSYRHAALATWLTIPVSVVVHLLTVLRYPFLAHKWTHFPDLYALGPFALLALASTVMLLVSLSRRREVAPIFWNAAIIVFSFIALSLGLYPHMIPSVIVPSVTVGEAAASPGTLEFMLIMTSVLVPVILSYTAYEFWVFRGKVEQDGHGE